MKTSTFVRFLPAVVFAKGDFELAGFGKKM